MNGMVDSRVVEMHFDNSDFMDKIEETIAALERLNDQISNINAAQGLSNLTSGADIGLSNVEDSLGNIESRFSVLGIVGMTIVQRLTNAAINSIQKVSNLLGAAGRQMRTGGFMRAENIEQAKFLLEGLGADVESVFGKVDSAVQGTAYGIDEAARAAASFYASGITNGNKLEHSLRAVAGVAAMTGSDFASIADIFTTVAGQGKVMTMQLRMMEGRGLNAAATMSKFFSGVNDGSIEASDSLKKAVKEITSSTEVSEEAVRDFVTKGKINFEVFSAAMDNAFGEHAKEANKTFSGSLANLKTALSRLGEAFYTPAMQAAIPMFNTLRESISSLTNNLKKSKVSQEIDKIISSVENFGKLKSNKPLVDISRLTNIESGKKLLDYLNGVSNGSIKASKEVKKAVKSMSNDSKISYEEMWKAIDEGKITYDIFNSALGETLTKYKNLSNVSSMVSAFGTSIKQVGNSIAATIRKFNESEVIANVANTIYNSFRILKMLLGTVKEAFKEVFPGSAIKSMEKVTGLIADMSKELADHLLTSMKPFKNVMIGVFSALKVGYNIVSGFFGVLKSAISTVLGLTDGIGGLSEGFRDFMQNLDKKTGTIGVFEKMSKLIEGIGGVASKAFDTIANGMGKIVKTVSEAIADIDNMNEAITALGLVVTALWAGKWMKIGKYRKGLLEKGPFGVIMEGVKFLRNLDIKDTMTVFKDILDNTKRYLVAMTKEVKFKVLKNIAMSVLALAIALKIMETIDGSKLAGSMAAVTTLLAEMGAVMVVLMKTLSASEFTDTIKGIYSLGSVTNALIKIGIAMILMATALKMISDLNPQELATGLIGLSVMLGSVLAFVLLLDKYQKVAMDDKAGIMLMGIAVSLLVMAKAIQILASLNPTELAKGLGSVVVLLGSVFGLFTGLSKMNVSMGPGLIAAGVGMIAVATAINILAPALQKIGSMPLEQLANGLEAVIAAMIAMAVASNMASLQGGAGILMLALGLGTLTTSIQRLGTMDINALNQGLIAMATALGMLIIAGYALAPISEVLLAVGGAMLMMAGSVAILGAGLVLIGAGLTSISAAILSFSSVTSTALMMFVNTIQQVIIGLIQLLPTIAAAVAEAFVTFLETIANLGPRFTEAASTIIHEFLDAINETVPDIVQTGINLILKLLSGISKSIKMIAKKGTEIISNFIEGVADGMDAIVQSGIDLILSFINGIANGIRNNKDELKAAITNLCEAILETFMSFFGISSPSTVMQQQGRYLMQGLLNGIKSFGGIPAALGKVLKSALGRVKGFVTKFREKGAEIVRNIVNGIKSKAHDIATNVGQAVTKAKNKITGVAGDFLTAGKNLVKGIASGIRRGASNVISAAGSIASRALSKFKSMLGISSPSRAFAEAARWIPEGIVVGINKTSNKVQKAVSSMSDSALDPLSKAISKAYYGLDSGMDFNPTITPVLDLSEVRKDATGINSILGDKSIALASSLGKNGIQNLENNSFMNQLLGKMDKMMTSENQTRPSNVTNQFTINVDGNENPEAFANRFLRRVQLEMRTG